MVSQQLYRASIEHCEYAMKLISELRLVTSTSLRYEHVYSVMQSRGHLSEKSMIACASTKLSACLNDGSASRRYLRSAPLAGYVYHT